MKFALFFTLFFSLNSLAYTQKDVTLSTGEFNRYIKPQLRNISQDYYTLLSLLNPELKNIKSIFYKYNTIKKETMGIVEKCNHKKSVSCQDSLSRIIRDMSSILDLNNQAQNLAQKKYINGQQMLRVYQIRSKYLEDLFQTITLLKDYLSFYQVDMKQVHMISTLKSKILTSVNLFNISILQATDSRFKTKFLSYWNDFIKPVNNNVLPKSDQAHFVRKLNDFNLKWNELNIELTKKNKPIPKQVTTLLNTMHNRWKSILKVTLR